MDKINNENSENNKAIIPMENQKIIIPFGLKNCIIKNIFPNILSPIKTEYNDILISSSKISNNVFSPRKKSTKLKNEKDAHTKKESNKCNIEPIYSKSLYPSNVKLFNTNNKYKTQNNDDSMKKILTERNFYDKYKNLENIPSDRVDENLEIYDYSMDYMIKNKYLTKKIQGKYVSPELTNKIGNINNLYQNNIQVINYNNINIIQHNNIVNPVVQHENSKKIQNDERVFIEDDNMNSDIKASNDFNTMIDTKANKDIIPCINDINELKTFQSLSLKNIAIKDIESNIKKQTCEAIDIPIQLNMFDDVNPIVSKKIKKGKKKNMGACFFNLNSFSCQFLMSCNDA